MKRPLPPCASSWKSAGLLRPGVAIADEATLFLGRTGLALLGALLGRKKPASRLPSSCFLASQLFS